MIEDHGVVGGSEEGRVQSIMFRFFSIVLLRTTFFSVCTDWAVVANITVVFGAVVEDWQVLPRSVFPSRAGSDMRNLLGPNVSNTSSAPTTAQQTAPPATAQPASSFSCPPGYAAFDAATCFRIYCDEALTFEAARRRCNGDGGALAAIDNKAQNEFVRELKQKCGLPWVLIGLTSLRVGGNDERIDMKTAQGEDSCWRWVDRPRRKNATGSFQHWDYGQPANDGQDEDCVGLGMHGQVAAGRWHDCGCSTLCTGQGRLPPVCRVDRAGVATPGTTGECLEKATSW